MVVSEVVLPVTSQENPKSPEKMNNQSVVTKEAVESKTIDEKVRKPKSLLERAELAVKLAKEAEEAAKAAADALKSLEEEKGESDELDVAQTEEVEPRQAQKEEVTKAVEAGGVSGTSKAEMVLGQTNPLGDEVSEIPQVEKEKKSDEAPANVSSAVSPNDSSSTELDEAIRYIVQARDDKAAGKRKIGEESPEKEKEGTKLTVSEKADSTIPLMIKRKLAVEETKKSKKLKNNDVIGIIKNGIWFANKRSHKKWETVQKKKIIPERMLVEGSFSSKFMIEHFKNCGLIRSMKRISRYDEQLVREIIVNLPEDFGDETSRNYGRVMVRGLEVTFSPEKINMFYDIDNGSAKLIRHPEDGDWDSVASKLTGTNTVWGNTNLSAGELSTKHAIIHAVAQHNWWPTLHVTSIDKDYGALLMAIGEGAHVDLGDIIFNQMAEHAKAGKPNLSIGFPSLIYIMSISQHPSLIRFGVKYGPEIKKFPCDHKLFKGKHVVDIPVPTEDIEAKKQKVVDMAGTSVKASVGTSGSGIAVTNRLIDILEEEKKAINSMIETLVTRRGRIVEGLIALRYQVEVNSEDAPILDD